MVATFNDNIEQAVRKRIETAIDELKEQVAAGKLSGKEYRRKAGEIAGLRLSLDLIDQAKTELMRR